MYVYVCISISSGHGGKEDLSQRIGSVFHAVVRCSVQTPLD